MTPKRPLVVPVAVALALVAGCTWSKSALRDDAVLPALGANGMRLVPKRCSMRIMVVARPQGDPVLGDIAWRDADPQSVEDDARHAWEANGLRVGRINGDLPAPLRALLDAPPPQKVEPVTYVLPSGNGTLVDLGPPVPQASLFLNLNGKGAVGRPYRDAKPHLRVTPSYNEAGGVALRIVPEIHHGPVRQGWAVVPDGQFAGHDFAPKVGQQEDTLRELVAELVLRPGQIAVLGPLPDRPGSLGEFLFTEPDGPSNRPLQKLILIWAGRADPDPGPNAGPGGPLEAVDPPEPLGGRSGSHDAPPTR